MSSRQRGRLDERDEGYTSRLGSKPLHTPHICLDNPGAGSNQFEGLEVVRLGRPDALLPSVSHSLLSKAWGRLQHTCQLSRHDLRQPCHEKPGCQ